MWLALRTRLTYANVIATIALFVALGGSSYAALKITGRNVPKDALTGADIKNLTGRDVRNQSLNGADVNGLTSADISNGRLLAEDFAAGQLPKGDPGSPGPPGPPGPTFASFEGSDPPADPDFLATESGPEYLVHTFTTPAPGRLLAVADYGVIDVDCLAGVENVGLYLDGAPVPGTLRLPEHASEDRLYHVHGVTAGTVAAGPHTLAVGVSCGGNPVSSVTAARGWSLGAVLLD